MSLISSRVGLRHLCFIERDASTGTADDWGQQDTPDWEPHLALPCHAWTDAGKEAVDADRTVVVVNRRVSLPLDTDVSEADRVALVIDKRTGDVYFDGPMNIDAVLRFGDHLELSLERVR